MFIAMHQSLLIGLLLLVGPAAGQDTMAVKIRLEELRAREAVLTGELRVLAAERDSLTLVLTRARQGFSTSNTRFVAIAPARCPMTREPEIILTEMRRLSVGERVRVTGAFGMFVQVLTYNDEIGWVRGGCLGVEAEALAATVGAEAERTMQALLDAAKAQAEQEALEGKQRRFDLLRSRGVPISISEYGWGINSAGGVGSRFGAENISSKEIKYVVLSLSLYNPVGDPARIETGGVGSSFAYRLIGPLKPGERVSWDGDDDPPVYAPTTSCIELRRVVVEFFDGTTWIGVNDLAEAAEPESGVRLAGQCQRP